MQKEIIHNAAFVKFIIQHFAKIIILQSEF